MKAIVLSAICSSFSSKKDKSMGFRVSTPELSTAEKVALIDLDGLNVRLLIEPTDYEPEGKIKVKADMQSKTPSQRLWSVLFVLYKHEQETGVVAKEITFASYYESKIEKFIDHVKSKLPEQ